MVQRRTLITKNRLHRQQRKASLNGHRNAETGEEVIDKKLHNSECFWCGSTFLQRQTEVNNIGKTKDHTPRSCGVCTKAKREMRDDRANKYDYWSWKEINATWFDVKTDTIEEAALRHFCETLPVEKETQQQLFERLRKKQL